MEETIGALSVVGSNLAQKALKYLVFDWSLDVESQQFQCDRAAQNLLFGETFSVLTTKKLISLIPKTQRNSVKRVIDEVLYSGEERYFHCCLLSPRQLFTYVEVNVYRSEMHKLKGTLSPCLNVSSASEAAQIFYSVFANQHHGVVVTDSVTRILACNQHFEEMSGYLRNEIVGLKTNIFNSSSHDERYYQELWDNLKRDGFWSGVVLSRHAKGHVFPQKLTIQSISPGGTRNYYIGFSSDLSSSLDQLEDIESGGVELLTQLPTVESFQSELERQFTQLDQHSTILVAVIRPEFTSTNVLECKRQFAIYLNENTNVLSSGYMLNGLFLACLPVSFEYLGRRVRDVAKTLSTLFHSFKLAPAPVYDALKAGSIGISIYGFDAESSSSLVSHAWRAMSEFHSGERRKISFYDRGIHEQIERKKKLEAHVKESLETENIIVHFQPIVSVKTQRVEKFEALCRFPDLDGETVSPQEYINIAEDLNVVVELDDLVCRLAFRQLNKLKQVYGEHISLSVNRSFNTHSDVYEVLKQVESVIREEALDPEKLTIEFTESAFFEGNKESVCVIQSLRSAGVSIAVDDFGAGCSSLRYLREKFFDVLKIDRAFITGLEVGTREYSIVKAIIQLAKRLDLAVVAEGVETLEELNVVVTLGVDYIQGFLFAKPERLEDILSSEHYCGWPKQLKETAHRSLAILANKHTYHLDPSDTLALVYRYFQNSIHDYIPVVDEKKCVGLISRAQLNLHMTPSMGTDIETNKEKGMWNKKVNRMQIPICTTLDWETKASDVEKLVASEVPFPWVLVDEHGHYKGLVEMHSVLNFLV